ncbi:hypothetical protein ScalyP_jg709 [Parmales sp. scaly parma]|nr:hypothetical protein ScalyP_jg709 [Parmales sp. scaly parma]
MNSILHFSSDSSPPKPKTRNKTIKKEKKRPRRDADWSVTTPEFELELDAVLSEQANLAALIPEDVDVHIDDVDTPISPPTPKLLRVGLVGLPNAGKSLLLNSLLPIPVSAVSPKSHTTRTSTLGILTTGSTQVVFYDTPGYVTNATAETSRGKRLARGLVKNSFEAIVDVDMTCIVIDAAKNLLQPEVDSLSPLIQAAKQSERNDETNSNSFCIILNKTDLVVPKSDLLLLAKKVGKLCKPSNPEIFMVSSLKGTGLDPLKEHFESAAIETAEHDFEGGITSDLTVVERVEEILREKVYRIFHKEIPYKINYENKLWIEADEKLPLLGSNRSRIDFDIIVKTKAHKTIVAKRMWLIAEKSKRDIEDLLDLPRDSLVLNLYLKLSTSTASLTET